MFHWNKMHALGFCGVFNAIYDFSGNQECAQHVFDTYQLSDNDLLKLIQEGPDYDMNEAGDHADETGTAENPIVLDWIVIVLMLCY